MANVEHSALTTSDLHEPKGASTAVSGQVYVADGAASGAWTAHNAPNRIALNGTILTITDDNLYIVSPLAGDVIAIYTVLHTAITTGDAVLTASIGGTNITGGVVTITQSGSAVGDVDSAIPTAANTVAAGGAILITNDGGATGGAADLSVTVTILIDTS